MAMLGEEPTQRLARSSTWGTHWPAGNRSERRPSQRVLPKSRPS